MLDYEIKGYVVHWKKQLNGKFVNRSRKFESEIEAIEFIKGYRIGWLSYSLEQIRIAIGAIE
jgi:hypothetical protein